MCWYHCMPLRGAVFFGTSVHIFIGVVMLIRWILMPCVAAFATELLSTDYGDLFITLTVIFGVYLIVFITLACIIYSGVEKNSITILKWAGSCFTVLQVILQLGLLILYVVVPKGLSYFLFDEPDSDATRIVAIATYICCLIVTLNYVPILLLYTHNLWKVERSWTSCGGGQGQKSSSFTKVHISRPILHQHETVADPWSPTSGSGEASSIRKHCRPLSSLSSTPSFSPNGGSENEVRSEYGFGLRNWRPTPVMIQRRREYPPRASTSFIHGNQNLYPPNSYRTYSGTRLSPIPERLHNDGSIDSSPGMFYYERPQPLTPHRNHHEPLIPPATDTIVSTSNSSTQTEEVEDAKKIIRPVWIHPSIGNTNYDDTSIDIEYLV